MPEHSVAAKRLAAESYGAAVVSDGVSDAAAAFERAAEVRRDRGLTFVHPFDDPMVVAGASTATQELVEDHPTIGQLVVPCSGGSLLCGAILGAAAASSGLRVVGVQPSGSDGVVRSIRTGIPTAPPAISTVADGLTAPAPGVLNLEMIRAAEVEVVTVVDADILAAMRMLVSTLRIVVEPSAAVALAALLADPSLAGDGQTGIVVSGSNVDPALLSRVLEATQTTPTAGLTAPVAFWNRF